MPKVVVPVTLDLSAEQIELLDEHGDLVADLLAKLIRQAHSARRTLDLDALEAEAAQRRLDRRRDFENLGRLAHRLLRVRMADAPVALHGKSRTKYRQDRMFEVADDLRRDFLTIKIAITWHRRRLRHSLKVRRERHVLDRLIAGESNQQIADALGLTVHTVARGVRDVRAEARSLGVSLLDLRERKAPGTPS